MTKGIIYKEAYLWVCVYAYIIFDSLLYFIKISWSYFQENWPLIIDAWGLA